MRPACLLCSGICVRCCESPIEDDIPMGPLVYFEIHLRRQNDDDEQHRQNDALCSSAFLVDNNSSLDFDNTSFLTKKTDRKLSVVIDWSVEKCGKNSVARNSSVGTSGYLCDCRDGFHGNPYDPNTGCTELVVRRALGDDKSRRPDQRTQTRPVQLDSDIHECQSKSTQCYGICKNTIGGFNCTCPEGTTGDPTKINGCILNPKSSRNTKTVIVSVAGVGGGLLILLLTSIIILLYKTLKSTMKKKLKQKHFHQNHCLLREQLHHLHGETIEKTKLFTLKELEKATNNFDQSRIIDNGGHGTIFKGLLPDQRVAAIKRSKEVNNTQIKEFINEVSLLSRINHRNVVKLYGCCLESEVPILVYEFISNGTLSHHLENSSSDSYVHWNDRVRIATEVARAIAYLHFGSTNSIIHRDLKSENILLDEKLTVKVSDFGASKTIMLEEETHITSVVQGTRGYLDPEYYSTGQLTHKSDVYAMGVILLELLTGEKPTAFHEEGNLITRFIEALRGDNLVQFLEPTIVNVVGNEDLHVVACLAETCLRLRGEERPTMKEVEVTLEAVMGRSGKKNRKPSPCIPNDQYAIEEGTWSTSETSFDNGYYTCSSTVIINDIKF